MRTRQSWFALESSSLSSRRPLYEALEHRRLQTTTSWTADSISNLSGTYAAEVLVGSNSSDPSGSAAMEVGVNGVSTDQSFVEWDSDPSDGLDSDWQSVQYSIALGSSGAASLDVASVDSVSS